MVNGSTVFPKFVGFAGEQFPLMRVAPPVGGWGPPLGDRISEQGGGGGDPAGGGEEERDWSEEVEREAGAGLRERGDGRSEEVGRNVLLKERSRQEK